MYNREELAKKLKGTFTLATGCTEPVAIALNAAVARREAKGEIQSVEVSLDIGLFKNAMGVVIPGTGKRSIPLCVALGLEGGNPDDAMNVLGSVNEEVIKKAAETAKKVSVKMNPDASTLYIETILKTDVDCVRVISYKNHDKIALVERPPFTEFKPEDEGADPMIASLTLEEMKDFADNTPIEDLKFLKDMVKYNRQISDAGMKLTYGTAFNKLIDMGLMDNSLIPYVQRVAGAASYARMTGAPLPVAIATGSGNQGITVSLIVDAVAEKLNIPEEKKLRALAMTYVFNMFAKTYIGTVSTLCSCGIAASVGAAVGIVYMLDGDTDMMFNAIKNCLGGITGMVCDGAKESCANKIALSATSAVLSSFFALSGNVLPSCNGILANDLNSLFENLQYLIKNGMRCTDQAIVDIMMKR